MVNADRSCVGFVFASFLLASIAALVLRGAAAYAGPNVTPAASASRPDEAAPSMIVALDWRRGAGAEGCIDGPTLRREVEGRLERRVFGNAMEADVFLRGQVERRETDF